MEYAWVGAVVTVLAGVLAIGSDRSRTGMWALVGVGTAGILTLLWGRGTGTVPTEAVPAVMVGLDHRHLGGVDDPDEQ
ncbi:hypothetical protein [Haloarchaeobius sp. DT45]|uniref:hypothetical protein n=1 Tax=Haloarchaeobius sp. DT45 TaxID=3446116 RepID=UPI003F6CBC6C